MHILQASIFFLFHLSLQGFSGLTTSYYRPSYRVYWTDYECLARGCRGGKWAKGSQHSTCRTKHKKHNFIIKKKYISRERTDETELLLYTETPYAGFANSYDYNLLRLPPIARNITALLQIFPTRATKHPII